MVRYVKPTPDTMWVNGWSTDDLEWVLRYGDPSREDLLVAAGIVSCYAALCKATRETREGVIRAMRRAPSPSRGEGES